MGAMPVGCYKQMSAIKEGVIMRLQCSNHCTITAHNDEHFNDFLHIIYQTTSMSLWPSGIGTHLGRNRL